MRIFPKLLFLGFSLVLLFVAVTQAVGGELIKPTRTLQSSEKTPGELSVFSEPPGLDVFLDQSYIGKTPIMSFEVGAGIHNLKVEDSETEIYLKPGQSLQLSLFKGAFIEIKEKETENTKKPEEIATEKRKTDEPTEDQTGYEPKYTPGYWPLKPSGPIK
jgi:hypothetical protein